MIVKNYVNFLNYYLNQIPFHKIPKIFYELRMIRHLLILKL